MKVAKKFFSNFEGYCCALMIGVMSIVVFLQVFFRFVIKSSLPWSEELARYLQVYITFFGTAYGIKAGAHLGIEAFTLLLPKAGRKALNILVQVCSLVICVLIMKFSIDIVASQMASGQVARHARPHVDDLYGRPRGNGLLHPPLHTGDHPQHPDVQDAG